ncbi:MAG: hypothetical protein HY534_05360 [Chloroflexi bacterium]|nr:hypothetical protein [Chloroflexota bacterium]
MNTNVPDNTPVVDPGNAADAVAAPGDRWPRRSMREALGSWPPLLTYLMLAFAVGFNAYYLYPEVAIRVPYLHDGVQHLLGVMTSLDALDARQDPTDVWLPGISMGFPLTHYYQHLPYALPAAIAFVLRGVMPVDLLFSWIGYLLLVVFPLSIYWSMRRFGFERLPSALAGLLSSLLSTNGLFGLDFSSYVWRGYGLFTQLWGMVLLPLALAQGHAVLRTGRGYFWAVLLLGATTVSHLAFGYTAYASIALFALVGMSRSTIWQSLRRLVLLLAPLVAVTSYFLLPLLWDSTYLNHSVWDPQWKYDSFGHERILGQLFRGEIFDYGRFPSFTILAGVGLLACLRRWREPHYRIPVVFSLFWLLLYFGRPTWGALLDVTPLARDFYLHRLIAGVHLGGMFLIGLGLALPWKWAAGRRRSWSFLVPAALTLLLLMPVYRERTAFLDHNVVLMRAEEAAMASERRDLDALFGALEQLPKGRVYAGLAGTWGAQYRVGEVQMYALLTQKGYDVLAFLYHVWSFNGDIQVLFDEQRPELYNLFNIRYVIAPTGRSVPDFVLPIATYGRHNLYEVQTSGFFDIVRTDRTFVGARPDFYPITSAWLQTDAPRSKVHPELSFGGPRIDFRRSFPMAGGARFLDAGIERGGPSGGRILSESVGTNRYEAVVEVDQPGTVMLKVSFHPNWHAYVDSVEAPTFMLMPAYLGVQVGPGRHELRMEYRPQPARTGLIGLSVFTLVLLAVAERKRVEVPRVLGRLPIPTVVSPRFRRAASAWGRRVAARADPELEVWKYASTAGSRRVRTLSQAAEGRLRICQLYLTRRAEEWQAVMVGSLLGIGARVGPHLPFLAALGAIVLAAGWPLLQLRLMTGHDYLEYLPRNVEFWRGLSAGQILPRWAPDLSGGYGEPFFNFNPPLIYYTTAFFHAVGLSFVAAENLASFALLALAGLTMYLLANEFFGARGGVVAASAYVFAPFLDSRLYVSHALADYSAFPFVPAAFWGLYRFARGGRLGFLAFGSGAIALLLLTSNPIALISFPAFVTLAGLLAWSARDLRVAIRAGWCLALGLGLAAFFWLPALVERDFVHVHRLLETFLNYNNHFAYVQQLFFSAWEYGVSVPGPGDGMSFGLGPVHIAATVGAIVCLRRIWTTSPRAGFMSAFAVALVLGAAFMSVREASFIWDRLPLIQYLEYPWRFHTLAAAGTAFLCAFPLLLLPPRPRWLPNATAAALVSLVLVFNLPHARPEGVTNIRDADYTPGIIAARNLAVTTAREYEPIWVPNVPRAPAAEAITVISGDGRVSVTRRTPIDSRFRVDLSTPSRLRINTFYFPGWTVYVDGRQRPVERNSDGVMEISVEGGSHQVRLAFEDTPVRLWSARLSGLAVLLLFATPWLARRRIPGVSGAMGNGLRRLERVQVLLTGTALPDGVLRRLNAFRNSAAARAKAFTLPVRPGAAAMAASGRVPVLESLGERVGVPVAAGVADTARPPSTNGQNSSGPAQPAVPLPSTALSPAWRGLALGRAAWAVATSPSERESKLAFFGLLGALSVVALGTFLHYGMAWDEEVHRLEGDMVVRWYTSFFQNASALTFYNMFNYGGLFEIVSYLMRGVLPFGLYEGRHLTTVAFGLLGIGSAYVLATHLAGAKAGFLAALFLTLTPAFYGHMFFNFKDVPFASLHLLSLYCIFRMFDAWPNPSRRLVIVSALAIGSTLGIRVGGVLLFGYLGLLAASWLLIAGATERKLMAPGRMDDIKRIAVSVVSIAALAWVVMLIWWPWAQSSPIANPLRALASTLYFSDWFGTVFFEGRTYPVAQLPWIYLPTWVAISLPEFFFVTLGAGAVLAGRALSRGPRDRSHLSRWAKIAILLFAGIFPVATAVTRDSIVYDGLRQFLFVVPPLAVVAGVAMAGLLDSRHVTQPLKAALALAVGVSAIVTVADLARLHPYEYVYFNRLVAGGEVAGARRFETDYWGLSYKEGVDWLLANYRPNSPEPVRVANCSRPILTSYFLGKTAEARQRFVSVLPNQDPQVFLTTTRFNCQNNWGGKTLHVVERAGVPLLYVKELSPPGQAALLSTVPDASRAP